MQRFVIAFTFLCTSFCVFQAQAQTICTLLLDAGSGAVVLEEGDCHKRVTPASTFKIPLAVMGYDAGILENSERPVLSFRKGDPDWGGSNWKRDTNPVDWMRYSVVWYSQRISHALGQAALTRYARDFGYGTADFTGDPGAENGLLRAWISSSLQVSPHEQAAFLRALFLDRLPVKKEAMAQARSIVESVRLDGWHLHGKTGAAYPRRQNGSFDYARGWGWYVGWAQSKDRALVFVRLTQARERSSVSPGLLTRDAFLKLWPELVR